ncbi:MAG: glycoside hydrolase family 15 protein [Cyanobacteria bacterium P01_F01_bin.42]
MLIIHNPKLLDLIKSSYCMEDLLSIINTLDRQGTFQFPTLETGLFSAAITSSETSYTGYYRAWVRDNIHIAHAQYVIGQTDIASGTAIALMKYFTRYRDRFDQIIAQPDLANEIMNRPHIRFDGNTLSEIDQHWSHAQNDALGYFLWFYCKLVNEGHLELIIDELEILLLFPRYFQAIQYWQDEDHGHWEEKEKVQASSIGTVVAGLRELQLMNVRIEELTGADNEFNFSLWTDLIRQGEAALTEILPYECRQPEAQQRRTDSALLFLIYPLGVVDHTMADQIIGDVTEQLQGEIGIRRYLMDSFWAPDYKTNLTPDKRTMGIDQEEKRDSLAQAGKEAQWCIFDPILSTIFGHRYHISGDEAHLQQQTLYLNRALGQLTGPDCPLGEYKCPELYYLEQGQYIANDATPLLWSQANLRIGLHTMVESLSR